MKTKEVTYLSINKRFSKYNESVRNALRSANISFNEISTKWGKRIFVEEINEDNAIKLILSIPHSQVENGKFTRENRFR